MLKIKRFELSISFNSRYVFVGLFWKSLPESFDVYLCLLPCLPLHFKYVKTQKIPISELMRQYAIHTGVDVEEFNKITKRLFPNLQENDKSDT